MRLKADTTNEKPMELEIDTFDPVPLITDNVNNKKVCKGKCKCQDCDDDHGDNVTW